MNTININALKESFKQFIRTVIFLAVAWLLSGSVITWIIDALIGQRLDEMTKLQIVGLLTLVLQYIDKWLHESDIPVNGLLPQTPVT